MDFLPYILFYITLGVGLTLSFVLFFKFYKDSQRNANSLAQAINLVQELCKDSCSPPELVDILALLSSIKIDC